MKVYGSITLLLLQGNKHRYCVYAFIHRLSTIPFAGHDSEEYDIMNFANAFYTFTEKYPP